MKRAHRFTFVLLLAAAVGLAGCSDGLPTEPAAPTMAGEALLGTLAQTAAPTWQLASRTLGDVPLVGRKVRLDADVSGTTVIGRRGGSIRLPEAGLEFVVPRGALRADTRITVTAREGTAFVYDFEPHGIRFRKRVEIRTDADHVATDGDFPEGEVAGMAGVYFAPEDGVERVLEQFPVLSEDGHLVIHTDHFSGYALASG